LIRHPALKEDPIMANELGKRYTCEKCGSSVLCTKGGEGAILCCEAEMELQEARKLPSSD
jgi:hypothetical protein